MSRAREEIEELGVRLVFIGQATPRHAAQFQRRYAEGIRILADEKRETYKAMGLPRGGVGELIGPRSVMKGIARTAASGARVHQGRPIGDVSQLGATMIVLPDGSIPWAHVSKDASDVPSVSELKDAATAAASPA